MKKLCVCVFIVLGLFSVATMGGNVTKPLPEPVKAGDYPKVDVTPELKPSIGQSPLSYNFAAVVEYSHSFNVHGPNYNPGVITNGAVKDGSSLRELNEKKWEEIQKEIVKENTSYAFNVKQVLTGQKRVNDTVIVDLEVERYETLSYGREYLIVAAIHPEQVSSISKLSNYSNHNVLVIELK